MVDINTRISSLDQSDGNSSRSGSGRTTTAEALREAAAEPQPNVSPSVSVDLSLEAIQVAENATFGIQATPNDQLNFRNDNQPDANLFGGQVGQGSTFSIANVPSSSDSIETTEETDALGVNPVGVEEAGASPEPSPATDISQVLPPPEEGEFTPVVSQSEELQEQAAARDARAPASGREDVISFAASTNTADSAANVQETSEEALASSPGDLSVAERAAQNRDRLEQQIAASAQESVERAQAQEVVREVAPEPRPEPAEELTLPENTARAQIVAGANQPSDADRILASASEEQDDTVEQPAASAGPVNAAADAVAQTAARTVATRSAVENDTSLAQADAAPEPAAEEDNASARNQGNVLRQFNVSAEDSLGTSLDTNA